MTEFWKTVNLQYTQQYFCNKPQLKTMGNIQTSEKNVSFYCLAGQWINTPMDKSWASMCSPVHKEFKNPCFIFVLRLVYSYGCLFILQWQRNLQHFFSMNLPFFWTPLTCLGKKLYLGGCTDSWRIQWAKNQLHTTLEFKSYGGWCECM